MSFQGGSHGAGNKAVASARPCAYQEAEELGWRSHSTPPAFSALFPRLLSASGPYLLLPSLELSLLSPLPSQKGIPIYWFLQKSMQSEVWRFLKILFDSQGRALYSVLSLSLSAPLPLCSKRQSPS